MVRLRRDQNQGKLKIRLQKLDAPVWREIHKQSHVAKGSGSSQQCPLHLNIETNPRYPKVALLFHSHMQCTQMTKPWGNNDPNNPKVSGRILSES